MRAGYRCSYSIINQIPSVLGMDFFKHLLTHYKTISVFRKNEFH
jgi:hypothetical protein